MPKPKTPEQKAARKVYAQEYGVRNRDKISAYFKQWVKENRAKMNGYTRKYKAGNTEKVRASGRKSDEKRRARWQESGYPMQKHDIRLRCLYRITAAQYDAMWLENCGRCTGCGQTSCNNKRLVVDHDHKTGRIRGLLCSKCNMGIGLLNDDPALCRKMAAYLEKHR